MSLSVSVAREMLDPRLKMKGEDGTNLSRNGMLTFKVEQAFGRAHTHVSKRIKHHGGWINSA